MPEKLHSVRYVADVLDLHPKTLYRKLRGNEIDLDFIRPTDVIISPGVIIRFTG